MSDGDRVYRATDAQLEAPSFRPLMFAALWVLAMCVFGGLAERVREAGIALLVTMLVGVFAFLGARFAPRASSAQKQLEASRDGVRVDGKLVVPRAAIDNGSVAKLSGGGALVLLGRKDRILASHTIRARDEHEANEILAALGLDPAHDAFVHREAGFAAYGAEVTAAFIGTMMLGIGSFVPLMIALKGSALGAVPAIVGMTACFGALWFTRSSVTVGAEGVLVRWLGFERYCAFADVVACEPSRFGVVFRKRDGSKFDVRIDAALGSRKSAQRDRDMVVARIRDALALYRSGAVEAGRVDERALARNARPVDEWLQSLRALFESRAHRVAALVPEDLWKIVASASASAESRVAAAVVLAPSLDDEGKTRLRETAANAASPRLRVALESAAKGDDGELARALEEMAIEEDEKASVA
jgi:hypothetical protein